MEQQNQQKKKKLKPQLIIDISENVLNETRHPESNNSNN